MRVLKCDDDVAPDLGTSRNEGRALEHLHEDGPTQLPERLGIIMEKMMETTIVYWGYNGVILG